jgi:hypothetical protein
MKVCSKEGKTTVIINNSHVELIGGEKYNDIIAAIYPQFFINRIEVANIESNVVNAESIEATKEVLLTEVSSDVTNVVISDVVANDVTEVVESAESAENNKSAEVASITPTEATEAVIDNI